jgi:ribonuclease HI
MAESGSWKKTTIHTDGGCDGNPGPGGWAALLRYGNHVRELTGGEPATTNNRMELQAAISALKSLKEPCEVTLFTVNAAGVTGPGFATIQTHPPNCGPVNKHLRRWVREVT